MLRQRATALVRKLHKKTTVTIHPQTRDTFFTGLTLYEARPDEGYSLTDCISMARMRAEGITEVLTHDDHFRQEGFTLLLGGMSGLLACEPRKRWMRVSGDDEN